MDSSSTLLRSQTARYITDRFGVTSSFFSADPSFIKTVSPGPMITNGDYKRPNDWNYDVYSAVPYHCIATSRDTAPSEQSYGSSNGYYTNAVTAGYPPLDLGGPILDNVYNEALSRLNEKVRGRLDLSIALAESGKTARMINVFGRALNMARNLRRFRPTGRGATKASANAWLEYQYGWRQLIDDVYNTADESLRVVLNRIQHYSAGCTRVDNGSKAVTRRIVTSHGEFEVPSTLYQRSTVGVKFHFAFTNRDVDMARFTTLNPVSIAWELIPYSFVADWFLDVGSFLRNAETAFRYSNQFVSGYYTILRHNESWESKSGIAIDGTRSAEYTFDGSARSVSFTRRVLGGWPLPAVPKFEARLGSSRLLSAAALLAQKLR